jgi:uncharacterized protein with LGFP repeats
MSDVGNQAAWSAVVDGLIFNADTAICQRWLQEKDAGNYLGVPVSDELNDDDSGGTQMAFSSGVIIKWNQNEGTSLA